MVKVLTVVGARPQFIKAAAVSGPLRARAHEVLVHTGQHYDLGMSGQFFAELGLPAPDVHLDVRSGRHGAQTGKMLAGLEEAIVAARPDRVLVYGDTNSTLAGALAAAKLHVPLVHVEAGLRSFDRSMPEEINRVVTDHVADLLCCPGPQAARNLAAEGITAGVHVTGDVMRDLLERARPRLSRAAVEGAGLVPGEFFVLTLHRAGNTDDVARLGRIVAALGDAPVPVVFPVHPRTRAALRDAGIETIGALRPIDPLGYVDMLALVRDARAVYTDSGGVQKEASWLGTRCVTLRDATEWVETVESGWNTLVGSDPGRIRATFMPWTAPDVAPDWYGTGGAADRIAELVTFS